MMISLLFNPPRRDIYLLSWSARSFCCLEDDAKRTTFTLTWHKAHRHGDKLLLSALLSLGFTFSLLVSHTRRIITPKPGLYHFNISATNLCWGWNVWVSDKRMEILQIQIVTILLAFIILVASSSHWRGTREKRGFPSSSASLLHPPGWCA